jgi:hypothetical protein
MKSNNYASPIRMPVDAMTTLHTLKSKSVCFQRPDEPARLQTSRDSSYVDDYGGFRQLKSSLVHRDCFSGFKQILNVQINSFADICQRFFVGMAPGMATLKRGARRVPGVAAVFEFVRFDNHFENVGFHSRSLG